MISNIMTCIDADIFVIIVHTFLSTTTWCLMMWMDYTHTHLKLKERLVPLKACRLVSLLFVELLQFVCISETFWYCISWLLALNNNICEVLKSKPTMLLVCCFSRLLFAACRIFFFFFKFLWFWWRIVMTVVVCPCRVAGLFTSRSTVVLFDVLVMKPFLLPISLPKTIA